MDILYYFDATPLVVILNIGILVFFLYLIIRLLIGLIKLVEQKLKNGTEVSKNQDLE